MVMDKLNNNPLDNLSEKLIKVDEGGQETAQDSSKHKHRKSSLSSNKGTEAEDVQLTEDVFGLLYDENGDSHSVKRYTWKNKNKIQVQVINYGARITSMKVPDRKGEIEDIVLGFDDLAGYLYYKQHYFGATIGRVSNIVRNSTFQIDNKQYWLTSNRDPHHFHGGRKGLDQVVWKTYVDDKKVIMSYVSPHSSEGYPGDLLLRIMFELSARNEFNIHMDAQCTQPTIVNLSNLTYFNLAGHYSGPDHIYKHILTINSNCFTPQANDMPTGEILNVVHTEFDFQIPKTLGKVMGIVPRDGYNHNLCINRGMDQDDCFVARVLHPPSGRMLEIYSNQWGVNFSTADEFGFGRVLSMQQIMHEEEEVEFVDPILVLFEKVHKELVHHLTLDERNNYEQIRELIEKIREKARAADALHNTPDSGSKISLSHHPSTENAVSKAEISPSKGAMSASKSTASKPGLSPSKGAVSKPELSPSKSENTPYDMLEEEAEEVESCASEFVLTPMQLDYLSNTFKIACEAIEEDDWLQLKDVITKILNQAVLQEQHDEDNNELNPEEKPPEEKTSMEKPPEPFRMTNKKNKKPVKENAIPFYYKSTDHIIGKERAVYKMHGGIALQTQNYPGCANYKNFPCCVLRPGETYKHTITYKYWIRAGNPNKWVKRNMNESKKPSIVL